MRTIGLIGGMSWYSSAEYYKAINAEVQRRLGGHHSAKLILYSVDFDEIRACQLAEDWAGAGRLLADAGRRLERAGADVVLIGTNLMHKVADDVEAAVDVPLLHIADAVGEAAATAGHRTLGVIGSRWVMAEPFYADRLARHGIGTVVPSEADQEMVDRVVFDELTRGIVSDGSRTEYVRVLEELRAKGADAVVLACTEIELLVKPSDSPLPLIDSMRTHALRAADLALAGVGGQA
ncbi:aspartate/glutamate racemase family protein [Georgenia subflava]|uniref:Amino acid racemase n=1 Tax=Georgenia subflava TaxID=1622177 RepID=A0A6N7EBS9_9MICO|nr:aspartate/glutamate racemase family protein [Georgenia subflava]MPV35872.1 amino acid racemase [Georgenia subflava]